MLRRSSQCGRCRLPRAIPSRPNRPRVLRFWNRLTQARKQAETDAILAALNSTRWNRKQAAALLKIDYKALLYKMKKLGVEDRPDLIPADATAAPKQMSAGGY